MGASDELSGLVGEHEIDISLRCVIGSTPMGNSWYRSTDSQGQSSVEETANSEAMAGYTIASFLTLMFYKVATQLRCGGLFNNHFIENCPMSVLYNTI